MPWTRFLLEPGAIVAEGWCCFKGPRCDLALFMENALENTKPAPIEGLARLLFTGDQVSEQLT
jgi:hypothetical protein